MPSGSARQMCISADFHIVCTNVIDNVRTKTILMPIESWGSGLLNGTRIISVRQSSKRFVGIDWIRLAKEPQSGFRKSENPTEFYHTDGKISKSAHWWFECCTTRIGQDLLFYKFSAGESVYKCVQLLTRFESVFPPPWNRKFDPFDHRRYRYT